MQNMQQQLNDALNRQLAAYDSLPDRMSNVEDTMSSIQGISSGVRDSWLLAEAEYYMQIANAQLQLAGNPQLARLALLQADDRIRQLANPALTHVRRALSDELRALKVVNGPDIEGITLTLASLADVVDSLPLRQQVELPVADASEIGGELSGLDRAIESLKSTMSDVVSVRRVDEEIRPLIAPESAYFLRANLSLQLQVARLALLRGEQAAFQQSLDDSDAWLGEYYDATSAQVQSARQTILEIRDSLFDVAMPDISESLRMLRQYNTLSASPAGVSEPAEDQPEQ
jgi:uroporphyrin-3 C-methyltransferase